MTKQNDKDDFEAVFNKYKGWVYKTAYLIVRDPQKAEDVMQEVFIKAYKSNSSYDPEKGSYVTWLRQITINQCLNEGRNKSIASSSIEEMAEHGQNLPDTSISIPEQISLREEMKRMFNSLSAKHRAVLVLKCIDGLSYEKITEVLGIPLGTVKSRINYAILALRERQKREE